jgi:hypothetical protein
MTSEPVSSRCRSRNAGMRKHVNISTCGPRLEILVEYRVRMIRRHLLRKRACSKDCAWTLTSGTTHDYTCTAENCFPFDPSQAFPAGDCERRLHKPLMSPRSTLAFVLLSFLIPLLCSGQVGGLCRSSFVCM